MLVRFCFTSADLKSAVTSMIITRLMMNSLTVGLGRKRFNYPLSTCGVDRAFLFQPSLYPPTQWVDRKKAWRSQANPNIVRRNNLRRDSEACTCSHTCNHT